MVRALGLQRPNSGEGVISEVSEEKEKQLSARRFAALASNQNNQTSQNFGTNSHPHSDTEELGKVERHGNSGAALAGSSAERSLGLGEGSATLSQVAMTREDVAVGTKEMPVGVVDVNQQQVDLRATNSWLLKIDQIETPEVAEVFAINTLAPFIINSKLIPLMKESGSKVRKFIVNVSAMEGKFYRHKMPTHPHTNMAKAALNMMTRTCSQDLAKENVLMNSVDTGWINDENPLCKAAKYAKESNFQTPIDEIDAAARILDPVFSGLINADSDDNKLSSSSKPVFGKFLKDYHESEW
eukprot:CAMPEP_0197534772 /NCGR_PEP_ID=MMETSP1318-20131121/48299_1 /TAXON_ID=552666 /ORGANISM="Partenskyella glossopodia, Strain RCC365" /LENGTH=297 /DNA_ID=CAMNT_0043092155 /DNA_START=62 /DNA_END=952 /DNA_ORIENTATION=-